MMIEELYKGVHTWTTKDGIKVLRIHYLADPKKNDTDWIAEAKRGSTQAGWDQEMEIDWTVTKGVPWFEEFSTDLHVAKDYIKPLSSKIIAGWDYGLTPATVFTQVTPNGIINVLFPELQSWDSGIWRHGDIVKTQMATYFPHNEFVHYGDPAGNQRSQSDERTCVQTLQQYYGINVFNGPIATAQRDIPLRKAMSTLIQGKAQLQIDPRNTWLIEALKGGYKRKQVNDTVLDVLDDNEYTHIVDALGYAISMINYQGPAKLPPMPKLGRL
jgi:hypothetical protein